MAFRTEIPHGNWWLKFVVKNAPMKLNRLSPIVRQCVNSNSICRVLATLYDSWFFCSISCFRGAMLGLCGCRSLLRYTVRPYVSALCSLAFPLANNCYMLVICIETKSHICAPMSKSFHSYNTQCTCCSSELIHFSSVFSAERRFSGFTLRGSRWQAFALQKVLTP